jgi:hypothetical protein
VGVGEPGALLGERGTFGLGEHCGLAPGGDQVDPHRGFTGGRQLLGVNGVGLALLAAELSLTVCRSLAPRVHRE